MQLNNKYGLILKEIKNSPLNPEEKIFLSLINGLNFYLNTHSLPEKEMIESSAMKDIPAILLGRYFGYQILYLSQNKAEEKEEQLWNQYQELISYHDNKRDLLHEFIVHMVLGKKMNQLEFILEHFYDETFDNTDYQNYIDQFIFNLIDVIISLNQGDGKQAVRVFSNLSIRHFFENSYCDYYLIFYYLVGSNLPLSNEIIEGYKHHYNELAENSGFQLFSEKYLQEYFN